MNTSELPRLNAKDKNEPRRFQLEFEKVSDAPKPRPFKFEVQNLSTGAHDSHLRKVVWLRQLAATLKATPKAKTVAKKSSTHLRLHKAGDEKME